MEKTLLNDMIFECKELSFALQSRQKLNPEIEPINVAIKELNDHLSKLEGHFPKTVLLNEKMIIHHGILMRKCKALYMESIHKT